MSNPKTLKKWVEFSKHPKLLHSQGHHKLAIEYCVELQQKADQLESLIEEILECIPETYLTGYEWDIDFEEILKEAK